MIKSAVQKTMCLSRSSPASAEVPFEGGLSGVLYIRYNSLLCTHCTIIYCNLVRLCLALFLRKQFPGTSKQVKLTIEASAWPRWQPQCGLYGLYIRNLDVFHQIVRYDHYYIFHVDPGVDVQCSPRSGNTFSVPHKLDTSGCDETTIVSPTYRVTPVQCQRRNSDSETMIAPAIAFLGVLNDSFQEWPLFGVGDSLHSPGRGLETSRGRCRGQTRSHWRGIVQLQEHIILYHCISLNQNNSDVSLAPDLGHSVRAAVWPLCLT